MVTPSVDQKAAEAAPAKVVLVREIIQYRGRQYSCTPEMAHIFLKHAREVIECGETQLVPLLHCGASSCSRSQGPHHIRWSTD